MGWGAFGGAAANAALSTYERLGEEELRDMQRKQLKKDIAEKEALDRAWADSQARVGQQDEYSQAIKTGAGVGTQQAQALSTQGALRGNTAEDQAFEKASAEAAVGAMRENAAYQKAGNTGYAAPAEGERAPQAALPELTPTEYTAKQGMQDYLKAASQVSRKGTLEAIQMKSVVRESEIQDKFDNEMTKLNDTLGRIQGTAESGGLKGLYEAGKKEGLKLSFVEGKNGIGSRINVLGPKGDVLETVSDVGAATKKLSDAAMQQFMQKGVSLLGSFDKVASYMQGNRQIDLKEREVAAKEAVIPSEIAKNMGQASWYTTKQDAGSWKQTTINETDPATGVTTKTPVFTKLGTRDGKPYVEAYRADGTPVTDKGAIKQIAEGGVPDSDGGAPAAMGRDLNLAAERYKSGQIDIDQYRIEQQKITQHYKQTATDKNLNKAGDKDPYAPTPVPAAAASKTSAKAEPKGAIPLSSEIEVIRSKGGTIYKVPGISLPFSSKKEAQDAYEATRAAAEKNRFKTTLTPAQLSAGTVN